MWGDPEFRARHDRRNRTRVRTPEELAKVAAKAKARFADPAYKDRVVRAIRLANHRRPTGPESRMRRCLDFWFPGAFRYVGDGAVVIGGKCPDFVARRSPLVLEVFGRYWHRPEEVGARIRHFRRHGYRALIVWEDQLDEPEALRRRLVAVLRTR